MRIFVTGASGFIGQHLCDVLQGHELLALMRQPRQLPANVHQLQGDLFQPATWRDAVKDFAPACCIHLAWSDLPDYSLAPSRKNFEAGLDLIQMMKEIGCPRVVVAGTCFEYGTLPGLVSEDQVPETQGLFAAFKTAQRVVGNSLLANSSTQLIWARLFYVFGKGQRPTSLIPSCIAALMAGKKPDIRSPDMVSDLVHVEDVASGLAALATANSVHGIYNLGSGVGSRVRDVANMVAHQLGQQDVYPASQEPGQGFWADMQRLKHDCGWAPKVTLEEGIAKTLRAWKADR